MSIAPKTNKLLIPIELLQYSVKEYYVKALQIFIYLKAYGCGKAKKDSILFQEIKKTLRIKDSRTINKHLNTCLKLGWLGYDKKSGIYFIRSFDSIKRKYRFKSRGSAIFSVSELRKFSEFVSGAIISNAIYAKKFRWEIAHPRRLNAAPTKKDGAKQRYDFSGVKPAYYGLSISIIAMLLHCSATTACNEKRKAARAGFINSRKHFKVLAQLPSKDNHILNHYELWNSRARKKLRIRRKKNGYELGEQLYDEIIPKVMLKKR